MSQQVREMEKQKLELISHVEQRLQEGNRTHTILQRKIQEVEEKKKTLTQVGSRRGFRDFESVMDLVEENTEEAESSGGEQQESVQLPVLPAFGQIEFEKSVYDEKGGQASSTREVTAVKSHDIALDRITDN